MIGIYKSFSRINNSVSKLLVPANSLSDSKQIRCIWLISPNFKKRLKYEKSDARDIAIF